MQDIQERVAQAQDDKAEMEKLLLDYMPYIRKQASLYDNLSIEYEDRLSISMLAFMNCIRQYNPEKGAFLPYTALVIRSRLIDESRRCNMKVISVQEEERIKEEEAASIREYGYELEKTALRDEIDCLQKELSGYGISFTGLCGISPKQGRSRLQCMRIARKLVKNDALRNEFMEKKRIPQIQLAKLCGISVKTVEKYRKYIITLAVLLEGDYGAIRTFLPRAEEVEE